MALKPDRSLSPVRQRRLRTPVVLALTFLIIALLPLAAQWSRDFVATWVVVLTGVVVVWYTWETAELRRTAQAQMDIQVAPFVMLRLTNGGLWVKNIGHGPALNVVVGDIVWDRSAITLKVDEPIPVIRSGKSVRVGINAYRDGKLIMPNELPAKRVLEAIPVTITCDNIRLQRFQVVQELQPLGMGGWRVTGFVPE